jgi:hypothetical protein
MPTPESAWFIVVVAGVYPVWQLLQVELLGM